MTKRSLFIPAISAESYFLEPEPFLVLALTRQEAGFHQKEKDLVLTLEDGSELTLFAFFAPETQGNRHQSASPHTDHGTVVQDDGAYASSDPFASRYFFEEKAIFREKSGYYDALSNSMNSTFTNNGTGREIFKEEAWGVRGSNAEVDGVGGEEALLPMRVTLNCTITRGSEQLQGIAGEAFAGGHATLLSNQPTWYGEQGLNTSSAGNFSPLNKKEGTDVLTLQAPDAASFKGWYGDWLQQENILDNLQCKSILVEGMENSEDAAWLMDIIAAYDGIHSRFTGFDPSLYQENDTTLCAKDEYFSHHLSSNDALFNEDGLLDELDNVMHAGTAHEPETLFMEFLDGFFDDSDN